MADNARGIHVSPGIYTREIDMTYAVRSLGITTLGVVGETLKGPAFQPMDIANWREFQEVFGGTSTEKFKGSQYPKYELPYIAKSYLTESEQLKVVRVLGLSGYNAGPAWLVTANGQAVALIRSRGTYKPFQTGDTTVCTCEPSKYDALSYYVGEPALCSGATNDCSKKMYNLNALQIKPYIPISSDGDECEGYEIDGVSGGSSFSVSQYNHGRFKLVGVYGKWCNTEVDTIIKNKNFEKGYFEYPVSLNPYDKEYILNVLGTKPYDGDAWIYVESLYDVALTQGIANGNIVSIDSGETATSGMAITSTSGSTCGLKGYQVYYTADYCHHEPVSAIVSVPSNALRRRHVGQRFLADLDAQYDTAFTCVGFNYTTGQPLMVARCADITPGVNCRPSAVVFNSYASGLTPTNQPESLSGLTDEEKIALLSTPMQFEMKAGQIYTVRQYTTQDGKRHYYYAFYTGESVNRVINTYDKDGKLLDPTNMYGNLLNGGNKYMDAAYKFDKIGAKKEYATLVLNNADGLYYRMSNSVDISGNTNVAPVELDLNDYKSAYRYASTPWIVSNLKGDYEHVELNKLFRFHTITDGNNANYEVKVSIENIRPDEGVFDVIVRRIDDVDESIIPLERFGRCSMTPGDSNFIGFKIGTFDGLYESKSKYITVEVNDSTAARMSVPAGFIGYPIPKYDGMPVTGEAYSGVTFPTLMYNRYFNPDVKNRKQYFGLSSWIGVDIDNFTFKGNKTYIDDPRFLSHGFHLDSRIDATNGGIPASAITVDGEHGYEFDCVSTDSRTSILNGIPLIGTEEEMYGSIYEYVNLRKFTVYFYGAFDGWDDYRDQRTNTDEYKMSQYRGYVNQGSGEGYAFNRIQNPELLKLNQNGITSDWYAYLSGIRQFSNPEETDINVFATPGIDYVNQKLLVNEAIEMIEEERADSIYVITTPDKPNGAGDYVDEMYTPDEAVYNLEDSEIDSNYSCTYYPWVKYLDIENSQYIYLPATKDVVRNFAQTDNTAWPWFAPAGVERGNVDCVRAHFITKLADEDVLYDGRINPIKTFAQDGPKIWGQKNLQINESQLNRIAVRRLLLRMRKLIAISCIGLIFEPNDPTTKQSFLSTVTPIMDSIRSNRGISDYRIEINDTIESRERRELPVKIYFKPYNALEYITIDFVLTAEGVSFDDI